MKKIMLTATALIFTVAMFAQTTGSAPVTAKAAPKHVTAQNQPSGEKKDAKDEKKKEHHHKTKPHKGKEHPKK